MFSRFQYSLAISPTSLHTTSVIVVIAWIIAGKIIPVTPEVMTGIWPLLPDSVAHSGWINLSCAILSTILGIYIIGNLNVSQVLLRINSRVMSFIFAALMSSSLFLHAFHPGYVAMICFSLSYFSLFKAYHRDNSASLTYVSFLYLGICVIVFPKFIWMTPVYWLSIYLLRAFNVKSLFASILGLVTPLWLVGSIAFCIDKMPEFTYLLGQMVTFHWGGYSLHTASQTMMIWFSFIIFMIGAIDVLLRNYLDKTRTRVLYYILMIHGAFFYLMLLLWPVHCNTLLPSVFVITSIMGGHYVANDESQISNIIVCMFTLFMLLSFAINTWIL